MTVDFLDGLQDYLVHQTALAALVGTRVYGGELPEVEARSMPRPAIVLRTAGGTRMGAPVRDPKVDVLCYGTTPKESRTVWLLVDEALRDLRRAVHARCLLHDATLLAGPIGVREPDTHWPMNWGSWQVTAGTEEAGG